MVLFMRYVLKWPHTTASAELISIRQCDWLIFKPHHVWRLRPRGQVCVLPSNQNYQPGHFLFCFFSFSSDLCFLFPPTRKATISYISQLLCLFFGWGDKGAVFLNAQVVFSPLSFLTIPSSSSPLHPTPPPLPTSHLYSPHSLISSPLFYLSISFLPLYLAIYLTSCPLSLSPFSPSLVLQTAERLSTKASYSSPHAAPSITPTGYSPRHCAKADAHTHMHTKLGWFAIEELAHTCTRQTSKQSAAREQCVDSQLILILWLCTIQYFFQLHGDKLNAHRSQKKTNECLCTEKTHHICKCLRNSSSDIAITHAVLPFSLPGWKKNSWCYQRDGLLLTSWITWPLSNLCVSLSLPGTHFPG